MVIFHDIQLKPKQKVSVTMLVIGLVCLTIFITATILLILSFHFKKQSLIDTALSLNSSNSKKMSLSMDRLFTSMRESLKYSVEILHNYPDMTSQEAYGKLELLRKSSHFFNSIAIVKETGQIHAASPASLSGLEGTVVASEVAKETLRLKAPYLSKPYLTPTTKRMIVSMSEPIFDKQGTYLGYIVGTIYLQEPNVISQVFGSTSIDENGSYYYVVSSEGHLLYHPDIKRVGENVIENPVVNELTQGHSGKRQVVNSRGIVQLAGYSIVPSTGWGIVVVSPGQAVDNLLHQFIQGILVYFVPAILLLLIIAIWLSRRLAQPFVALARLISHYEQGQSRDAEVSSYWNREADLLAKTIGRFLKHIEEHTDQLSREAMIDPLTGLVNRRGMEKIMNQWMLETEEYTLLIMDIDRFKTINDTYGHPTGDVMLNHLARLLQRNVLDEDVCCRYGGEEFVVLLKRTPLSEAYATSERIRCAFETDENPIGRTCTLSIGLAHYPTQTNEPAELLSFADQALYEAKRNGRNQSVVYNEDKKLLDNQQMLL
ncbi:GGDEF domain-containing protein [Paenibacillus sp. H1-7]|uniref:sensor domain-containing diguanylate cyclase n=1 Tax=Paenibacillus sp. H1-7 TaxID=2282849 RepID=UPI001EF7D6CA|nr:sensor domain-containing diguanylate cyclase [Paenibacillus sp. H1-7]ULL17079.1 GGDEF domain-containing protein [Paenibacillus sp. H1-7]